MENHQSFLDTAFHALAHPTRRAVIGRLIRGPASVKQLAEPFNIGLPSFMKHLRVLEKDGLVLSEKTGRVRICRVNTKRLAVAESWLAEQRQLWQSSADRLADFVENRMDGNIEDAE